MLSSNIGKNIKAYRKDKGMTQHDLASMIGISDGAVSKWETDSSKPDIELLPTLARALEISMDELFSFERKISELELINMKEEIGNTFMEEGIEEGKKIAYEYIRKYPRNRDVKFIVASQLRMQWYLFKEEKSEEFSKSIIELFKELSKEKNSKYSVHSKFILASIYLELEKYDESEKYLKSLSESYVDPMIVYSSLLERQEKYEESKLLSKQMLLSYLSNATAMLSILSGIYRKENNYDGAKELIKGAMVIQEEFAIGIGSANYALSKLYLETGEISQSLMELRKYVESMVSYTYNYDHNKYFKGLKISVSKEKQDFINKKIIEEIESDKDYEKIRDLEEYKNIIAYVRD